MRPDASTTDDVAARTLLRRLAQPVKSRLSRSVVVSVAEALLMIAQAWLLAQIITRLSLDTQARLGEFSSYYYALPAVFILRFLLGWAAQIMAHDTAQQVKHRLRQDCLSALSRRGPVALQQSGTGKQLHLLSGGVEAVEAYIARYLPARMTTVLIPLAIAITVAPFDLISVAVMVFTAPLIPVFMILIGEHTQKRNHKQWREMARMSGYFLDRLQGLLTLKLFGAARAEAEAVGRIADRFRQDTMHVLRVAFLSSVVLEFLATVSIAMIAVFIGFRLYWGEMHLADGLFILLLAPEFYLPLRKMGGHYHARLEAVAAASQLSELLEEDTEEEAASTGLNSFSRITFDHLSLSYPDEDGSLRPALRDVSFEMTAGECVALCGPSGAGKSSVVNLLLGFVPPTEGRVLIDGQPLNALPLAAWRQQIAWVPQQPYLCHGSIRENIALANRDADDEAIMQAAKDAELHDDILAMPLGYDTPLGERGTGLSGGQIRRLALARAFLRDAPLLILDEPTASLDRESETRITDAIARLTQGRTVILIAHRRATLQQAQRVIALENGRLTDQPQEAWLCD